MATLAFNVEADYEKVIKLRDEIARLEQELNKVAQNGTPDEIARLEQELNSCRREMKSAVAVASQLGSEIEQGVGQKMQEASQNVAQFGEETQSSLSAIKEMEFGTAQEKIDALSYAIYNNEVVIADSVKSLEKWREDARKAFEEGDTGTLEVITKDITQQVDKIQELTRETEEYRTALNDVLTASGIEMGGDTPIIRLFDSEEEIAHVEELQRRVVELKAEIAQVGASGGDTTQLTRSLTQMTDELNQCKTKASQAAAALGSDLGGRASEAQQQLYELNRAIEEQNGAIEDLQSMVSDAREAFETLSQSESASADEIERASASYQTLADALTQAQEKMAALQGQQQEAQSQWNAVNKEIELQDNTIVKMCGGYDNFRSAISLLPAPLQATVNGIVSMTSASMAFILTPIGATIAAIALGLQALHQWFTKSAEGQRAFAKVTGFVNGVLGQLAEIVLKVGKYIYEAFTNPQKVIQDFGKLLERQVMNRVNAVGGMFSALGKIMKNVFSGDFNEAGKAVKELGNQYLQAITGVEDFADKTQKAMQKVSKAVTDTMDIESAELALREKRSAQQVKDSEYETQIAELRNKAARGTDEERLEATNKAMELINKRYDEQLELAQEAYDLQKKRNGITTNSIEDNERLQQLEVERNRIETQRQQAQTRFLRQQNTLEKRNSATASASAKDSQKVAQEQYNAQVEVGKLMLALRRNNQQAEIDLMKDGAEKQIAQIEKSYREQIAKIEALSAQLAEANKKAGLYTEENGLTQEQNEEINLARENANREKETAKTKVYEQEKDAMWAFLKEYGTYEQQRLAITEEYAKKIEEASNVYEKIRLNNERDAQLHELEITFYDGTDWEKVFGSLDTHTDAYLRRMQDKLREMLNDKSLTAEQAEALGARLVEIQTLLVERSSSWADYFGVSNDRMKVSEEISLRLAELEERRTQNLEKQAEKEAELNNLQKQIQQYSDEVGVSISIDDIDNLDELMSKVSLSDANEEEKQNIRDMVVAYGQLKSQANQLKNEERDLDKTIAGTEDEAKHLNEGFNAMIEKLNRFGAITSKVADALNELSELTDVLGLSDTGFGQSVNGLTQSATYATQAFDAFTSGNPVGAITGVVGAVKSLGQTIFSWFGGGDSDKNLARDIERLTASNNDLANAIEGLSGEISSNTTSLAEAQMAYEKSMEDIAQMEANTQEMMERSAHAYSNGFLGIGGHKSSNTKVNDAMSATDWARVSEAAGASVKNASDFWNLTSEQMYNVSIYATDLYTKIKQYADDGYKDAAQYMDDYIEYWKELEEVTNTYYEKLTSTSFDNVADSFKSAVSDMSHTAADFADDFENMMKEAVINSLMVSKYNQQLEDWYGAFANAMESNSELTSQEQQELKDDYMRIVEDARNEIEAIYKTMGWSENGYAQQGSAGGWETISEDTGEELNGRFTALQETGLELLIESREQGNTLVNIYDISTQIQQTMSESYLELQAIDDNTRDTVTQLVTIAKYIKSVKENTDKL